MKNFTKDAFKNLLTGLGSNPKDRSTGGSWETYVYDGSTLASAYSCDWLTQQLVNIPADEATRKWRKITTPSMTPEQIEAFEKAEKELKVKARIASSLKWASLFGGGGIYIAIDGQDPKEELVIESIRRGAEVTFTSLDRNDVIPESIYNEENFALFMEPAYYQIAYNNEYINGTRFLRFEGVELPNRDREQNLYWSGSRIAPILSEIERCATVSHAITQLLDEANVDVISVEGLFAKLANATTATDVRARFAEGEVIKTLYNVLLLDSKEEYHRHELSGSLTGLTAILAAFYEKPAAAMGIPVTKLLGISPGGLNATGESDLENFYDRIDTIRHEDIASALYLTDAVINQTLFGRQFDDWSYEWEPLWQISETEKTDNTVKKIDSLLKLGESGVITSAIVARQVYEDGTYSAISEDYVEDLESLLEGDEAGNVDAVTTAAGVTGGEDVAKQALNGAQIAQTVNVVSLMNIGEITRNQAFGLLKVSIPTLSDAQVDSILGSEADIKSTQESQAEKSKTNQTGDVPPQFGASEEE